MRVTVPVALAPPRTLEGVTEIPLIAGGLTVRGCPIEVEDIVALIVGVLTVETGTVEIANGAEMEPDPMLTVAGTLAEV